MNSLEYISQECLEALQDLEQQSNASALAARLIHYLKKPFTLQMLWQYRPYLRKLSEKEILPSGMDLIYNIMTTTSSQMKNTIQILIINMLRPCMQLDKIAFMLEYINGDLEDASDDIIRASVLYDYLDSQDYYIAPVEQQSRSMMNVTFVTGDADLDKKFASEAAKAGLKNLKGHRSVGGMRASIYNAMPYEGVEALVAFMKKFAEENPKA